jgi:hypothetical protein
MATKTPFLELLLPALSEYRDTWHIPVNANMEKLDSAVQSVTEEVIASRQGKPSLLQYLQVSINSDGSLKATPEVVSARNSFVYGQRAPVGNAVFALKDRLNQIDTEVWKAREGQTDLLAAMAFRENQLTSMVLSGTKNANGYPTWFSSTAASVIVNGLVTPIWLMIDGKQCRVRTQKTLLLTGGAGLKYVYVTYSATGSQTVDGDSSTAPPSAAHGTTSLDTNSEATVFTDVTRDFTTEDVQPGDLLTLLTGGDAGQYIVKSVAPGGTVTQLTIVGVFPVGGLSSIDYTIGDRFGVTLGFDTTITPAAGKLYLGEAYFDGTAVATIPADTVSTRALHFKDLFVGEWRAVDVSATPSFEVIYQHGLRSTTLDVSVQVSQANDGSLPIEELSLSQITSSLVFTPSNGTLAIGLGTLSVGTGTLAVSAVGLSAGSQTITTQPSLTGSPAFSGSQTLTGTVGGSLSGSVQTARSVKLNWDQNKARIKNALSGVFYKDYADVVRTSGYIRVVIRKRG